MTSTVNVSSDTKKPVRGRPRRFDRDIGVAAAERLFHAHGYDAVGVSAICDAVGVRQPALYAAYGSKAGLFSMVLEHYAKRPHATFVATAANAATSPHEVMGNVLSAAAKVYASDTARVGCLALEASVDASDPDARRAAATLVERTKTFLTERYGAVGASDPDEWTDATLVGMHGLSRLARTGSGSVALSAAAARLAPSTND